MKPGFFDFLADLAPYEDSADSVRRLNTRHDVIIAPLAAEIAGAKVLDLAAHDGRWAHAFAGAGAASVLGIEGRADLVARYAAYPDTALKSRVHLEVGDIFDGLDRLVAAGDRFDVVGVLGIFYHIMDHFRLLRQVCALRPKLVIVDSEFALRPGPVIAISRERTDNPLNAIAQRAGQSNAVIGIPSPKALEFMAEALDMTCDWIDWDGLPETDRGSIADYYRTEKKCRSTALLRPR